MHPIQHRPRRTDRVRFKNEGYHEGYYYKPRVGWEALKSTTPSSCAGAAHYFGGVSAEPSSAHYFRGVRNAEPYGISIYDEQHGARRAPVCAPERAERRVPMLSGVASRVDGHGARKLRAPRFGGGREMGAGETRTGAREAAVRAMLAVEQKRHPGYRFTVREDALGPEGGQTTEGECGRTSAAGLPPGSRRSARQLRP